MYRHWYLSIKWSLGWSRDTPVTKVTCHKKKERPQFFSLKKKTKKQQTEITEKFRFNSTFTVFREAEVGGQTENRGQTRLTSRRVLKGGVNDYGPRGPGVSGVNVGIKQPGIEEYWKVRFCLSFIKKSENVLILTEIRWDYGLPKLKTTTRNGLRKWSKSRRLPTKSLRNQGTYK